MVSVKVMITVNDLSGNYVNGTIGIIQKIVDNGEFEESYLIIKTDKGKTVNLYRYSKDIEKQVIEESEQEKDGQKIVKEKIVRKKVGSFSQFPVKLAWAISIHKSQGQTFEKINIDPCCWDPGQFYVAVSRAKSATKIVTIWGSIKASAHQKWNAIWSTVSGFVERIKNAIVDKFTSAKNTVVDVFNGMRDAIRSVLNNIISVVNGAISKVNGVVSAVESAFSFGPWKVPTPFGSKTIGFKATFPRVPTVPYLARPWLCVLRFNDAKIAAMIADMATKAARNNLIGYDQGTAGSSNDRYSFWQHLKASNYDPAQITVACESDCSASTAAIVKGAGYRLNNAKLKAVSIYLTTRNMRAAMKAAGAKVLTDSKYLTSGDYLKAGDILLNDNHHVAIAVTTGAKVSTSSTTLTGTFQTRLPILRKGSSGTAVAMLQAMLGVEVDGQFGNDTYDSLKVFQKNVGVKANGTCGIDTWKKVIEHMKANTK